MKIAIPRRAFIAGALASAGVARASTLRFSAALDRARGLDQLRSLVISVNGEVVAAEAVRGPAVDVPVNVKSVSKSVVAALAGVAIDRGELPGVTARLGDVAADLIPENADPRVRDITVEDLVTMRAGLERTSGANYGQWVSSSDWVRFALSRPFTAVPGGRFLYSTGSFHVLGAVLADISGRSLLTLARERLGAPLDIALPPWTRDPQGRYLGGNNMAMSPLGMIRFGEAYRTRSVVPADWVAASWTARARSPWSGDRYGYGWFLTRLGDRFAAYARGYGGQMIFVVPSLALTVAITSDPTRPARSDGHVGDLRRLVAETILPTLPPRG